MGLALFTLWWVVDTALAQGPAGKSPSGGSPTETFTYQGRLLDGAEPANGPYDFRVSIYDAEVGGSPIGGSVQYEDVVVTDGTFSLNVQPAPLNTVFTGGPRWLLVEVRPGSSTGAFTALPRQPITGSPYAWGLRPGAVVSGEPAAWDGWVLKTEMTGTFPAANAVFASAATGSAVRADSSGGNALFGTTDDGYAVYGKDAGTTQARGYGGYFSSDNGVGVYGESSGESVGSNQYAPGVYGKSAQGVGVYGRSNSSSAGMAGVLGYSANGYGVIGATSANVGVGGWAYATTGTVYGVYGSTYSQSGQGGHFVNEDNSANANQVGLWAGSYWHNIIEGHQVNQFGESVNLRFRVSYTGDVYADGTFAGGGADLAERIDATTLLEPGDVVEIDPDNAEQFRLSRSPYSTLVAGVVSTKPAVAMNNNDLDDAPADNRPLLALAGQVPVKVSAENGAIRPGDLLVSSSTPGHAMKAGSNPAPGSIIGKALQCLDQGTGIIKMLAALR